RHFPGATRRARGDPARRRQPGGTSPADAQAGPGHAAVGRGAGGQVPRAGGSGSRQQGQGAARAAVAAGNAIDARLARALFAPRAVALVGASGDAAKNTARPQRYLRKHGYTGRIFPVNPSRREILSEPCFSTVREIPEPVDHALIMVQDVETALEDCAKRGVPVASIYSDGFADAGPKGAERQARLVARARELGVRLLGPNSMGVIDIPGRIALTVNAVVEMDALPAGAASLVSQSGTMLGTLLSRGAARGLGFAKLVSVGNEADLGVGELVDLLVDDADTRVILLFLETVRDAARLTAAARRAHAAAKP